MKIVEIEPTCEGCKSRDRMIRQLSERIDELESKRFAAIKKVVRDLRKEERK